MPIVDTMNITRASDLVLSEDQNARYSRDTVTLRGLSGVRVGHLLKESRTAGEYEPVIAIEELPEAEYIAIYNEDELHGNKMAVIARHAQIRPKFLKWPEGTTDEMKLATALIFEEKGVIFRD